MSASSSFRKTSPSCSSRPPGAHSAAHSGVERMIGCRMNAMNACWALSVTPSGAGSSRTSFGKVIAIFSTRPACSSPPRIQ